MIKGSKSKKIRSVEYRPDPSAEEYGCRREQEHDRDAQKIGAAEEDQAIAGSALRLF
jgi:hypothetical protein